MNRSVVCGVDVGSVATPSWVAWLREGEIILDMYLPAASDPLPHPPPGWPEPVCIAFDAPQGLPAKGLRRRTADRQAKTPTSVLPTTRAELARWTLYRGPVELGVQLFWWVYESRVASIHGLPQVFGAPTTICETYPRFVATKLWPLEPLPSKTKDGRYYVADVYGRIVALGYRCIAILRPAYGAQPEVTRHDQVDAMLCALAAEAWSAGTFTTAGDEPTVDTEERVLREGPIVVPQGRMAPR